MATLGWYGLRVGTEMSPPIGSEPYGPPQGDMRLRLEVLLHLYWASLLKKAEVIFCSLSSWAFLVEKREYNVSLWAAWTPILVLYQFLTYCWGKVIFPGNGSIYSICFDASREDEQDAHMLEMPKFVLLHLHGDMENKNNSSFSLLHSYSVST